MPRVPIIDQPSVRQAPLSGFRESLKTESPLGNIGEGIQRGAQMTGQIVDAFAEEKNKADAARAVQELGAFTREADQQLMDPTVDEASGKPIGYKHLNGEDAFGSRETYLKKIDELAQIHEEALTNDNQKKAFRAQAYGKITGYHDEIQSHAGLEAERAISTGFKVGRDAEISHLRGVAENDGERQKSLDTLFAINLSEARRMGLSSTAQAAWVKNGQAEANASVMDSLIANDKIEAAEKFYATAKDNLGVKGDEIARRLTEKRTQFGIEKEASQIVGSSIIEGVPWVNRSEVDAKLKVLPEGPHKEHVRALVEHQVMKLEQSREEMADRVFSQAISTYFVNGQTLETPALSDTKAWLLDPRNGAADRWMKLVQEDFNLKQRARGETGAADKAQKEANALAISEFNAMDPGDQKKLDVTSVYLGRADEKTRNVIIAKQKKITRIIDGGGEANLSELKTFAEEAATDAGKKGPAAKEFSRSLRDWGESYLVEHDGRMPTRKEMKEKIADELLMVKEAPGEYTLWPSKMTQQEARKRGVKTVPVAPEDQPYGPNRAAVTPSLVGKTTKEPAKDIPAADRDEIVKALSKKGIAPTEENIRTMYQRSLGQ